MPNLFRYLATRFRQILKQVQNDEKGVKTSFGDSPIICVNLHISLPESLRQPDSLVVMVAGELLRTGGIRRTEK